MPTSKTSKAVFGTAVLYVASLCDCGLFCRADIMPYVALPLHPFIQATFVIPSINSSRLVSP